MREKLIEAGAKARHEDGLTLEAYGPWEDLPGDHCARDGATREATPVVDAVLAALAEPTEAMVEAGAEEVARHVGSPHHTDTAEMVFAKMMAQAARGEGPRQPGRSKC